MNQEAQAQSDSVKEKYSVVYYSLDMPIPAEHYVRVSHELLLRAKSEIQAKGNMFYEHYVPEEAESPAVYVRFFLLHLGVAIFSAHQNEKNEYSLKLFATSEKNLQALIKLVIKIEPLKS